MVVPAGGHHGAAGGAGVRLHLPHRQRSQSPWQDGKNALHLQRVVLTGFTLLLPAPQRTPSAVLSSAAPGFPQGGRMLGCWTTSIQSKLYLSLMFNPYLLLDATW